MTEEKVSRSRIKTPTCETCKWFLGKRLENSPSNYGGGCSLNPPVVLSNRSVRLDGNYHQNFRPTVFAYDSCSHHESAFELDTIEEYPSPTIVEMFENLVEAKWNLEKFIPTDETNRQRTLDDMDKIIVKAETEFNLDT